MSVPSGEQFVLGTILGAVLGWWVMLCTHVAHTSVVQCWVSMCELGGVEPSSHPLSGPLCFDLTDWFWKLSFSALPISKSRFSQETFLFHFEMSQNVESWWGSSFEVWVSSVRFSLGNNHTSRHTALPHCWPYGRLAYWTVVAYSVLMSFLKCCPAYKVWLSVFMAFDKLKIKIIWL